MFNGCSSLQKIDISNFNMEKTQYLQRIFNNCPSLDKGEILVNKNSYNKVKRHILPNISLDAID